jgi:hypothetical protein
MGPMSRCAFTVILGLGGLACAGRDAPVEDPDLQPLQAASVQEAPVVEPDEVIETPNVGLELIGKEDDAPKGPTQTLEIEDEASPHDQVVVPPKRTKSGSFMSGVKMNPNK